MIHIIKHLSCKEGVDDCIKNKTFSIATLFNEEKSMDMHIHDCYEIHYSITGSKQFFINDRVYDIDNGDLFVINQFEHHYLTKVEESPQERIVILIHPEFLKAVSSPDTALDYCFTNRTAAFSHKIYLNAEQQQRFIYFIDKITTASGFGADRVELATFIEMMVLINKIYMSALELTPDKEIITFKYNPKVADILSYINNNITEPFTIEDLSKSLFLSTSYVCRVFKAATGTTINKYMVSRRINIAKNLLANGATVSEACYKCGFNDYSNFVNTFTRTVGVSPKKYTLYSTS